VYVDRLNQRFNGSWSWGLTSRQQVEDQIIVEGRLTAAGITKTGLGGTTITRRRDNNQMVGLADDLKIAEADAIKRACRLLGIGRDLYLNDADVAAPSPQPRSSAPSPGGVPAAAPSMTRRPVAAAPVEVTAPPAMTPASPAHAVRNRLSSKQFGALRSLSRGTGHDDRTFKEEVRKRYGVEVAYLSRSQASELIGELLAQTKGHDARGAGCSLSTTTTG